MTKPVVFDEIDEAIVRQFQENGRSSNRTVGEAVGLSEGAVRKRLKRLTEKGAISYGLIVDIQATGMETSGYLAVQVAPRTLAQVSRTIAELEVCSLCLLTTGSFNVRAYLYGRDRLSLAETTSAIAGLDGVLKVEFREAVYFPQHRYQLLMKPDEERFSAWKI